MDILTETERYREVLNIKINLNLLSSRKDIPKGVSGDSAWQTAQRGQLENSSAIFVALVCLLKQTTVN